MSQAWPTWSDLICLSSQALSNVWDNNGSDVPEDEKQAHIQALSAILQANLSTGRYERANGTKAVDGHLLPYGLRVAEHYWAERNRLKKLSDGDLDVWEALHQQLLNQARKMLRAFNMPYAAALRQAQDCTQEACQKIACASYPYDVPFDAWAGRILSNCVRQSLRSSRDLLDQERLYCLDEESAVQNPLDTDRRETDGCGRSRVLENIEIRDTLLDAISQLPSEAQRQVILLGFFYDWEVAEIADALDRTCQAVYNLRHRALSGLKDILEQQDSPD